MAWYRAGSVTVTQGSAVVTGAGTDFVSNTSVGEAFLGADGRVYEIVQVVSATQIVLGAAYQGASAGGQGFAVLPTQSFARDLALGAAQLLNTFAAVRDGIGQGLIADGSAAAPGIRFSSDQDTGLRRYAENSLSLVTAGVDRLSVTGNRVGINNPSPSSVLDIFSAPGLIYSARIVQPSTSTNEYNVVTMSLGAASSAVGYFGLGASGVANSAFANNFVIGTQTASALVFAVSDSERMRIDAGGNVHIGAGATSGTSHTIRRDSAIGSAILTITQAGGFQVAQFFAANGSGSDGANAASAALKVGSHGNGRSIATTGTVNASGADYAEYILKAAGCGRIAKGDVCGVDRDGRLTKTWADAVSFVVKSTDPSLVGGDTWDTEVGPKPEEPGSAPVQPVMPTMPGEDASEDERAAWNSAVADYPAQLAAYQHANAEWQAAADAHAEALTAWEVAHEKARHCVDRIAFCGQVPVNVTGNFAVGNYIIAAAEADGIQAVAIADAEITFEQYRRRIGKVWAVRDGRAWVDVQHG